MKPILSPSMMCMDIFDAAHQIEVFNKYCSMLHVDIMDGHFAKNLALSPDFVSAMRSKTPLPIDSHLMVDEPAEYIEPLAKAGSDYISVHCEAITREAYRVIRQIKKCGCKFGVVICPATPFDAIMPYIDEVDMLTIMSVEVGYVGQTFIPQMIKKISTAEKVREENKLSYIIQSDGGVGPKTYKELYQAGTRAFVMGSSGLFKKGYTDIEDSCKTMLSEFYEATGVML